MSTSTFSLRHNEKGLITLDFIFAIVMVFGLSGVLFALTFTLSIVEVVQYISFSTARVYFAAHVSEAKQQELAKRKFSELRAIPAFAPLFQNGWFELGQVQVGDFNKDFPEPTTPDRMTYHGARIPFTARLLEMRVPFLGNTYTDDNGFIANISSYLAREPSTQECVNFAKQRLEKIRSLLNYSNPAIKDEGYVLKIGDNGC